MIGRLTIVRPMSNNGNQIQINLLEKIQKKKNHVNFELLKKK